MFLTHPLQQESLHLLQLQIFSCLLNAYKTILMFFYCDECVIIFIVVFCLFLFFSMYFPPYFCGNHLKHLPWQWNGCNLDGLLLCCNMVWVINCVCVYFVFVYLCSMCVCLCNLINFRLVTYCDICLNAYNQHEWWKFHNKSARLNTCHNNGVFGGSASVDDTKTLHDSQSGEQFCNNDSQSSTTTTTTTTT